MLWVILLGCLMKVAVQLQYGRHCIAHAQTSFHAWNGAKGLRIGPFHWSVYCAVLFLCAMLVGQGGVLGGAAQAARYLRPEWPIGVWLALVCLLVSLFVFRGSYRQIEIIATALNAAFISLILYCVFAVQATSYAFGMGDIATGFSVKLPADTFALALTAFGITGVSAGEIMVYPTWCIEKGYAKWAGARDDSPEWAARARGWMRVMTYDAMLSMVVYTLATVAFYFLGASILHAQGAVPDSGEMVGAISKIFTEVLGGSSMTLFLMGAFVVLFSTAFSNLAGHSRLWVDFLGLCRVYETKDLGARKRILSVFAFVMPLCWALSYLLFLKPILLVIVLGVANAIFLLVVAYHAISYRYRYTSKALAPSRFFDVCFWLSIATIGVMAARVAYNEVISKLMGA